VSLYAPTLLLHRLPDRLALGCRGFVLTDDVLEATPYVLPVMVDRMVIAEHFQFEPSEEGRLRLIRLMRHLLDLRAPALMAEHSQEILTIVVAASKDGAPEVKKVVDPSTLTLTLPPRAAPLALTHSVPPAAGGFVVRPANHPHGGALLDLEAGDGDDDGRCRCYPRSSPRVCSDGWSRCD